MSNEDHADQHGGWEPTPQSGEYDAEATAFVHLPPEDLANAPLAAPGQGYVPPMILPLTPAAGLDPAATGSWVVQTPNRQAGQAGQARQEQGTEAEQPVPEAVHWPDPNQQQLPYGYPQAAQQHGAPHQQQTSREEYPDQYRETPATTGQWNFTESAEPAESAAPAAPAGPAESAGHTGQWKIPVADGDLPEESGEFSASPLAGGWYADRTPPATLPGGAPAPWATQEPESEAGDTPPQGTDLGGTPDAPDDTAADARPAHPELSADAPDAPHEGPSEAAPEAPSEAPETSEASEAPQDAQLLDTERPLHTEQPDVAAPVAEVADGVGDIAAPDADAQALDAGPAAPLDLPSEHPSASYTLHVNGADRPVADAWIGESLLYVLRERLGLAGAKDGCSQGECGACNVQVDGRLVASCLVPAATAAGSEVRTVEGLAVDGEPSDVQRALADCGAVQCGFCIPGMAMTVHDLLEGNHAPSELETRRALCGNLCRCSGYRGVLDAVNEVIAGREAASAPAPESAEPDEARIPHQAAPGAGSVQAHLQDGGPA